MHPAAIHTPLYCTAFYILTSNIRINKQFLPARYRVSRSLRPHSQQFGRLSVIGRTFCEQFDVAVVCNFVVVFVSVVIAALQGGARLFVMAAALRSFTADPEDVEDEVNDHAEGAAEAEEQRVNIAI